jgi:hypothetical protein
MERDKEAIENTCVFESRDKEFANGLGEELFLPSSRQRDCLQLGNVHFYEHVQELLLARSELHVAWLAKELKQVG